MTRRMIARPWAETADLLEMAARIARGIVEGEQATGLGAKLADLPTRSGRARS